MNNTSSLQGNPACGPKISLVCGHIGLKHFCLRMHLKVENKGGITLGFGPKKPKVQNTSFMDLAFELNIGSQIRNFLWDITL